MTRALLVIALAACGTPPPEWSIDAGDCVPYEAPPPSALMTPSVSFTSDVMPILTGYCTSSICHGISSGATGDLFLGAQLAKGSDAGDVYGNLVGKPSGELPAMSYVLAGSPGRSYLMHKLDNDQCTLAGCVDGDCKARMPYQSALLSTDERDTIRRWIAQGALQN